MPFYRLGHKKNSAHLLQLSLKQMLHALPQFVFIKNRDSVYLDCNENYAHLVGLQSPEQIMGKTDQDLNWQVSGHTAEVFRKGDQDTMQGHPIENQQEILVLPDGKKLIALVSKRPIFDKHHKIVGIIGYFSDVTALKEKEQALNIAKQQAEAANQAKSVFLTNISHEIRTPLTGLLGMAQILLQESSTTHSQAAMTDLMQAAEGLLNFLNEVIEFSKWDSGDLPVYEVKFNLPKLIADTIALVTPLAKTKHLALNVALAEAFPEALISDVLRLQRILLNLLDNAIKFTAQGSIDLRVQAVQKQRQRWLVQFQIQDTGIGIPKIKQPLIFTRFGRLHPAYQGHYTGAGLGLALVKRFVSELGGEIEVESEENQGATFTCLIPLQVSLFTKRQAPQCIESQEKTEQTCLPATDSTAMPAAAESFNKQILLVEDNLIAQQAIKSQLESAAPGLQVDTANDGQQALQKIQYQDFDLIVMDIGLPDMNGCDVAIAMHHWQRQHQHPLSPIVALSAHLEDDAQQRCLGSGIVQVFIKPLNPEKTRRLLALLTARKK